MSNHAAADALIAVSAELSSTQPVEAAALNAVLQAASARATLAVADQLAALVEQQRLQLLVSICATSAVTLSDSEHAEIQRQIRAGLGLAEGGAS